MVVSDLLLPPSPLPRAPGQGKGEGEGGHSQIYSCFRGLAASWNGSVDIHFGNHSRYGPFPVWASRYGPHGGRYGPPR